MPVSRAEKKRGPTCQSSVHAILVSWEILDLVEAAAIG